MKRLAYGGDYASSLIVAKVVHLRMTYNWRCHPRRSNDFADVHGLETVAGLARSDDRRRSLATGCSFSLRPVMMRNGQDSRIEAPVDLGHLAHNCLETEMQRMDLPSDRGRCLKRLKPYLRYRIPKYHVQSRDKDFAVLE